MSDPRPLVHVASHLLNQPLAITEQGAVMVIAAVRSQLNVSLLTSIEGQRMDVAALDAMAARGRNAADNRRAARNERRIFAAQDGIAIIPITGTLTKTWGLDPYSGMTGYDGIREKVLAAMEDDDIDGIFLDIDSPGGAVAGCFDLVDIIYASSAKKGGKPIYAIANEQMCSAAYAIGSAADKVFTPRTGEVGSVGVITLHADYSKALDKDGVKVTVLRAGAHKAEGSPYEPLKPEVAARIQETIEDMRSIFIDTVARNMNMTKKAVRETEALTYIGEKATGIGFATAVASTDQAWTQLLKRLGRT